MRQRGYRSADFETIESLGTTSRDGIVLRKKDIDPELKWLSAELKMVRKRRASLQNSCPAERNIIRQIERARRLTGTFIPLAAGHALSIYRPCERRLKHLLRGRRTYRRKQRRKQRRRWI